MALAYLGLGANLGARLKTLRECIRRLDGHPNISVVAKSPYYETGPQGGPPQPQFINAVVGIETGLSPQELLKVVQRIEHGLGRRRSVERRWGPRTIDIDILLYDDVVIDEEGLKIPHPMMHQRRFVLEPLADIAPAALHPVLKKTISQLLGDVKGSASFGGNTSPQKALQNV